MKAFLLGCGKVLLVLALALVVVQVWPVTVVPVVGGLVLVLGVGFVLLVGTLAAGAVGVAAVVALMAAAVAILAVLAPVWVPVLLIAGIVALVRRSNRSGRPTATPA